MIVFDTDTLTLYFSGHQPVMQRLESADEMPAITIISRIEVLQGRFDSIVKAASRDQLLAAQDRLTAAERDLTSFAVVPLNEAAADNFERLGEGKGLKKIGRKDLLIACIALAHRATLVTRNLRHFRQVPGLRVENWAG
jgi:tRNA(fMet)-specific endonuclease VapC